MGHIECDIWRISSRRMLSEQMISHAVCAYGYVCDSENRALKLFRVYNTNYFSSLVNENRHISDEHKFSRFLEKRYHGEEKNHSCRQQIQKRKRNTLNTFVVLSTY